MTTKIRPSGIPRSFEIVMAVCGLVLFAPLLGVVAALIKVNSAGPIIFRQRRVGRYGREFTLLKFRTMSVAQKGALVTASNDNRITSIGRLLRKTKIDEIPGLWNVVRGEMSFVGPRPEVPEFVVLDDPRWQEILEARPGITDPVTLRLRSEENLLAQVEDKEGFYREILQPYKIKGYLSFMREKSLKTDINIIGRTLKAVVLPHRFAPPTVEEMGRLVNGKALNTP